MSHSNVGQTNFIGTHESVYRDSPIGNLEKVRIVEIMQSPLQQGFYGNIETCVLSEVILVQNLPFGGDDGNRKAFAVHINSDDVLLRRQFSLFLGEISDNLKSGSQSVGLACPSGLQKVGISLEIAILNNRDRDGFLGKHGELHERHRHIKCLAIAGNVEFEGNSSGFAFASPYRTFNIADNLRIKGGAFLG